MTRTLAIAAALAGAAVVTAGRPARGDAPSPGLEQRVAYIAGLLEAIETTDRAELVNTSNYLYAIERNKCQAPVESLHVSCVAEAAARNCQSHQGAARERCQRASDVIAANRLSEKAFVPEDVRYEIMDKHRDYRPALERELYHRYAIVVAELVMSPHFPGSAAARPALAAGIESYCRELSGTRSLAWQYCVAAVVWFIGTGGGRS